MPATRHVTRRRDDVCAVVRKADHGIHDLGLIRTVGHRDQDEGGLRVGDPCSHRVENATAQIVSDSTKAIDVGQEPFNDRTRGVPIEVPDDDQFLGRLHADREGAQDWFDRGTFVEDGQNDRELRLGRR